MGIHHLSYEVTFPSTGRVLKENIDFEKGFGAVVGPNGAGKSSVIEMLRYCLYGSAALRGKAEDYKTLKSMLKFSIRGVNYTVERSSSGARLYTGDELIVSGTKPVNQKIAALMGFGLTVFDVACVANQGDIEKLGSMKPTERKQMVDSVIGLGVIEDIAKWVGEEANALKREAAMLASSLIEPQAPQKPDGYEPSTVLQGKIDSLVEIERRLNQAKAVPSAGPRPTSLSVEALTEKAKVLLLVAELKALPQPSTWTEAELDQMERDHAIPAWIGVEQPNHDENTLKCWLTDWANLEVVKDRASLEKAIQRLEAGATTCPECQHSWTEDDGLLQSLKVQLEALPNPGVVTQPPLNERQIRSMLDSWAEFKTQEPYYEKPKVPLTMGEIATERHKLTSAGRRAELEQATKDYDGTDYASTLVKLEAWLKADAAYREAQSVVVDLEPQVEPLPHLRDLLSSVKVYDQLWASYQSALKVYDEQKTRVDDLNKQASDWTNARTALVSLRTKVKQYLVPSLNRVASHYIKQMTGGIKQKVEVSEDFEVLVDNQSLSTLSGSEKAVANLSLRLGLGQVLTNGVFPVFIGDEIDASMDTDRASKTAEVMRTLTERLSQILLVTHKYPEADYYINIGDTT